MPVADNPCRCCPEILAKQFPFFLQAPTKTSKNLETSVSGCHPKADEATGEGKSYTPISLLCVPFKIMERLIYARIELILDPLLPQEQARFRRGRSTTDQVTLLTQGIEDSFLSKKKAGAFMWTLQLLMSL